MVILVAVLVKTVNLVSAATHKKLKASFFSASWERTQHGQEGAISHITPAIAVRAAKPSYLAGFPLK